MESDEVPAVIFETRRTETVCLTLTDSRMPLPGGRQLRGLRIQCGDGWLTLPRHEVAELRRALVEWLED
jgi:hypothetical protein